MKSSALIGCFLLAFAAVASANCPTVRRGSRGNCVRIVQRAAGVTDDGIFGRNTHAAVRDLQSCFSLAVDGIVGRNTWRLVNGGCGSSCPTVRRSSRGACARVVQRHVGTTADGIFGRNTERAVRSFQSSNSLSADGIFGRNSWAAVFGSEDSGESSGSGTTQQGEGSAIANSCGCGYQGATGCGWGSSRVKGPAPGAIQLRNYIETNFGNGNQISGIYNCRSIRGGRGYSTHAEGRAVDYFVTQSQGGRRIMDHLIEIACDVGIQEVIFNRRRWQGGVGERAYGGVNPHTDHIHVSLNKCGAYGNNHFRYD